MQSEYIDNLDKIIAKAKTAKAIYVPVCGTGGASVKVSKADFLDMMGQLENFAGRAVYVTATKIMYIGG